MNINLHIERLILNDVDITSDQKKELKESVETALKRQLVDHGIDARIQSYDVHHKNGGSTLAMKTNCKTASLGQQIGNAVYKEIYK